MCNYKKQERFPLPKLTNDTLPALMAERIQATRNSNTVVPLLWQGFAELGIPVGEDSRSALYYIPEDTPQGSTVIVLNIPEGEETIPFLEKSGWLALADRDHFCLYALEPGASGWNNEEEEAEYLRAGLAAVKNGQHLLLAFAIHVVGYGRIGAQLHKLVMEDPLHTAAAVFFDASQIDNNTLSAFAKKEYFYEDRAHGMEMHVPLPSIPLPVWITSEHLDEQTLSVADYWKQAALVNSVKEDPRYGQIFCQSADSAYTPEGQILQVAVQERNYNIVSPETTALAYAFLMQYYRYGMGAHSNMISRKVDLNAMGVKRYSFTDQNGIEREYIVYPPKGYRDSKKKLPAIFVFHGASQTMRNMMENGLWYHIADQNGILLIFPESTLQPLLPELTGGLPIAYRPLWMLTCKEDACKELVFVEELMDRIIADYPVDESRMFSTGHSMGCMITNYLGSTRLSRRFAALSGTSGCLKIFDEKTNGSIPVFFSLGQYDLWSYDLKDAGPVTDMIDLWLQRNSLCRGRSLSDARLTPDESFQEGRYFNSVWNDSAGIPWLRYAWAYEKHHVHTFEENQLFWNEWFSRWQLLPNGRHQFNFQSQR